MSALIKLQAFLCFWDTMLICHEEQNMITYDSQVYFDVTNKQIKCYRDSRKLTGRHEVFSMIYTLADS